MHREVPPRGLPGVGIVLGAPGCRSGYRSAKCRARHAPVKVGRCPGAPRRRSRPSESDHTKTAGQWPAVFVIEFWSGRRDLNPRRRPWQGRTLPLSYSRSAPLFREPEMYQSNSPVSTGRARSADQSSALVLKSLPIQPRARIKNTVENIAMQAEISQSFSGFLNPSAGTYFAISVPE